MTKRERTRAALLRAAFELFAERGYDATTTKAIADRAGVTEMTLFRHFPGKASLVVDDPYDPLIADAVRARPADERAIVAAARAVLDAWSAVEPPAVEAVRERLRLVAETPSLLPALAAGSRETEQAIGQALVDRGDDRATSGIVAASVVAGLNAALLQWSRESDGDLGEAIATAVHALAGGAE